MYKDCARNEHGGSVGGTPSHEGVTSTEYWSHVGAVNWAQPEAYRDRASQSQPDSC